jgi:predicted transcriptional regulator
MINISKYSVYEIMTKQYYRERHEIIAGMLRTISNSGTGGTSKTPIMYKSFLSYAQLKGYLLFLVEKGLVEEYHHQMKEEENKKQKGSSGDDRLSYKITEKGIHILQICDEINALIG